MPKAKPKTKKDPRRKQPRRKLRKQFTRESRIIDAKKWLRKSDPQNIIAAYARRYGVSQGVAERELVGIGYLDKIMIQGYEEEGIAWEYRVESLSGEMVVVPAGIEECEIHEIYSVEFFR